MDLVLPQSDFSVPSGDSQGIRFKESMTSPMILIRLIDTADRARGSRYSGRSDSASGKLGREKFIGWTHLRCLTKGCHL